MNITFIKSFIFDHFTVSGSIFQGFEEQLNQTAEDIIPYYWKNNTNHWNHEYYKNHEDYYQEEQVIQHLSLIFIVLCVLTLICFIIMIVVCVKCCCSSGGSQERRVFAPNQGYMNVFHKIKSILGIVLDHLAFVKKLCFGSFILIILLKLVKRVA